jgi:hypothetical protein
MNEHRRTKSPEYVFDFLVSQKILLTCLEVALATFFQGRFLQSKMLLSVCKSTFYSERPRQAVVLVRGSKCTEQKKDPIVMS